MNKTTINNLMETPSLNEEDGLAKANCASVDIMKAEDTIS